jgi:alanine racemase
VPGAGLDTIRAGIGLAGAYATGWVPRVGSLRGAVALKARVVRFHTPAVGTSIGYGRTYKVFRPMRVALIACGYADGLPRGCSNRGRVLVRIVKAGGFAQMQRNPSRLGPRLCEKAAPSVYHDMSATGES